MSTITHIDLDRGNGGRCFHPGDDLAPMASVSPCFHPDDEGDVALAEPAERPVSPCHHPADDLASDLHLALTGMDQRELAAVAGRR
jgi:hypothetical protein